MIMMPSSNTNTSSANMLTPGRDLMFFLLFSFTLLAFSAVGIRYIGIVFNHTTRWVLLALLMMLVLRRGYLFRGVHGFFGVIILLYCSWICATVLWSLVPNLSAPKAAVNFVVVLTCFASGYAWTRQSGTEHAFSVYAVINFLVIVSGVFGATTAEASIFTGSVTLYRGLAYNPNLLGILVIMSMPWTLWFFYMNRQRSLVRRTLAYLILGTVLSVLLFTGARSSLLAVGLIGIIYLYYAGFIRYAALLGLAFLAVVVALMAFPELMDQVWGIIIKGQQEGGDIFYSRWAVWDASIDGAEQGGLIGVGYGVSVGYTEFQGGLSSSLYGREKGNSALAVLEELGQVGFVLYVFLIFGFLASLVSAARKAPNHALRVQIGLVIGTVVGLLSNSQFEAWWGAPGAPASPFFWSLAGSGIALAMIVKKTSLLQQTSSIQRALRRH